MTAGDANSERAEYNFSVTSGDTFTISFWAKRGAQGTDQQLTSWVNLSGGPGGVNLTATWTEYTYNVTATATGTATIRIYACSTGATGDEVYIDNLSIVKTN